MLVPCALGAIDGSAPISAGVAEAEGAETLEMKVKRLKRENAYLRRQREILKKAASILAEDPQGGMR